MGPDKMRHKIGGTGRLIVCLGLLALMASAIQAQEVEGVLRLEVDRQYVRSGDSIVMDLTVSQLARPVKACQAFLGVDNYYLTVLDLQEGGAQWDDLIYGTYDPLTLIDTAIGVYGQTSYGSQEDGTVLRVLLQAGQQEGVTKIFFRPDVSDVESTFLADMEAQALWPAKFDSPWIVIDNTPPQMSIEAVHQGGQCLIEPGVRAVQGEVLIVVRAVDALAGLDGQPQITVTQSDGVAEFAEFVEVDGAGNFIFRWTVTAATANGATEIVASASDRSGNVSQPAAASLVVNKNRITGQVELQGFVGNSRTVVFTATGQVTRIWVVEVTGFSGPHAQYVLNDVPDGVSGLSAKTQWHLRRRIVVTLDSQGQAVASFTDASKLLGGDLNGSNLVNVQDYTILRSHWFTSNPVADITGSGLVNGLDYTILKLNWMVEGDRE